MLLFLRSLRNSLIVLVAIPASLVSAFVAMGLFGYTLNLMTLLAMSLIIGILVDDSIVILENIQRYLDKGHGQASPLRSRAVRRSASAPCPSPWWTWWSSCRSSSCRSSWPTC